MLSVNGINAQALAKETIAVLPFIGLSTPSSYTNRIIARINRSYRFKVINQANLNRFLNEHNLHLTELTNESILVEFGRIINADKFMTGTFSRPSLEFHEEENGDGGHVKPYHAADISALIRIFDVESASYIEEAEVAAYAKGQSKDGALSNALEKLADNVITYFEKYFAVQAYITSIDKSTVLLDRGYALGIREGSTFEIMRCEEGAVDPVSGKIDEGKVESIGAVYISEVRHDYSKGKIIKGIFTIREGMLVEERNIPLTNLGLFVSYAPIRISIQPNTITGIHTISNSYTGSHEVYIDYTDCEEITNGRITQISGYARSLADDISLSIAFDRYELSAILKAWGFNGYLGYHWSLIPDLLYISPQIGIGWGQVSQKLPGGIVPEISDGTSSTLSSKFGPSLSAQLGVRAKLGPLIFTVEGCYRSLKASKWYYRVKTGRITTQQTGDGEEEEVEQTATIGFDPGLAVYPRVNLSSVYFKIGIAVELPKFW